MRAGIGLGLCVALLAGEALGASPGASARNAGYIDWRGPYFLFGAGVEGYTGKLAPNLNPGLTYGVLVGYRATNLLGVEVGYSGGINDVQGSRGNGGPDIVRNGAQAAFTVAITSTRLQPFGYAGIGVERYSVRHGFSFQFIDDTGGYAPLGAGLRYQLTPSLTAEFRGGFSFLFGQDFALVPGQEALDGRYHALLQLGGSY
ncbi:outer membrane beta-barrel protein [Myxococcaceae bacterium JPH2]|nr:outer membrane beta-barrel protein [Myxococcaceae bacterium JPH2]